MAALQNHPDQSGKIVLQSPILSGPRNFLSMLMWLGIMAVFFAPALNGDQIDWANLALLVFFALVTAGSTIVNSLLQTVVTVDPAARKLTSARRFLTFPLQIAELDFKHIENIAYEYYRQERGRNAHDAWRVAAVGRDGERIILNWDGKKEEMAELAQKASAVIGAEISDNSEASTSTAQEILDRMGGEGPDIGEPTSMPDTQVQPDSLQSEEPWQLPRQPVPGSMSDQSSEKVVPAQVDAATPDSVWSLSIDELEKRIAADTLDSDARFALARRYQAHGQFDRAIDLYQKAIQLDPANANAQNDMGVALQQRGRRAEAEVAYRRAAALDPFSSTAHVNLGLLLRSLNRASEASQAFFQARKNARGDAESKRAEAASAGGKLDPQLSRFQNS